jgi:hypothetical protein
VRRDVRRGTPASIDTPIIKAEAAAVVATRPPRGIYITVLRAGEYIGVLLDADAARAIARDLMVQADKLDPPKARPN